MHNTNILLVDDETAFVDTLNKRLSNKGLRIIKALDGLEALEKLDNDPTIEVVVLDIKMPDMDGIQTLIEIKRRFPSVEVIILTGHATADFAVESMKSGAFDFLMKPCDSDQLILRIQEAVSQKESKKKNDPIRGKRK